MKKLYFTSLFLAAFALQTNAQSEMPARHNKTIFVEVLGNGVGISANFDMRFKKGVQDGLGFRAGLGGVRSSEMSGGSHRVDLNVITIPLSLNYLVGKRRSAFEAGIGITPLYAYVMVQDNQNGETTDGNGWGAMGFVNLGYRFQPLKVGPTFRLNWTPGFGKTGFFPAWVGISAGIGFK